MTSILQRKQPDWVYYQLNGKSAAENYQTIVVKRKEALDDGLQKEMERSMKSTLQKALAEVFEELK